MLFVHVRIVDTAKHYRARLQSVVVEIYKHQEALKINNARLILTTTWSVVVQWRYSVNQGRLRKYSVADARVSLCSLGNIYTSGQWAKIQQEGNRHDHGHLARNHSPAWTPVVKALITISKLYDFRIYSTPCTGSNTLLSFLYNSNLHIWCKYRPFYRLDYPGPLFLCSNDESEV